MKTKHLILLVAFLGMFSNIQAQDATLEETLEFIKLRTIDKRVDTWFSKEFYCNNFRLEGKKIFLGRWSDFKSGYRNYYIDLTQIRSFKISDGYISTLPKEVIQYYNFKDDGTFYDENHKMSSEFFINYGEDAPRVLKAYKHLLDLLGIILMEEKF